MHNRHFIAAVCLFQLFYTGAGDFHEDDFVPTSRRAQFRGVRTHWHDLLGRHCPRFGVDHLVALPIPEPKGFQAVDNYKIQLTFDGDRLVTAWLKILGKGAPEAPMLKVSFVRTRESLRSVSAQVVPVPPGYLYAHHALLEEFRNASVWPKHLLVQYAWAQAPSADALAALYLALVACLVVFMVMVVGVIVAYESKLKAFMAEMAAEDGDLVMPAPKGD